MAERQNLINNGLITHVSNVFIEGTATHILNATIPSVRSILVKDTEFNISTNLETLRNKTGNGSGTTLGMGKFKVILSESVELLLDRNDGVIQYLVDTYPIIEVKDSGDTILTHALNIRNQYGLLQPSINTTDTPVVFSNVTVSKYLLAQEILSTQLATNCSISDAPENFTLLTSEKLFNLGSINSITIIGGCTVAQYNTFLNNYGARLNNVSIVSNICFPKGTMVHSDQGWVEIQNLHRKNTFGGHRVVAVTETTCVEKCLIEFEPFSVTPTAPIRKLRVSKNHAIKHNGILRKAKDIVNGKEVPFSGQVYNVLLNVHGLINVEGLECETLHPGNSVATLYTDLEFFQKKT